MFSDEGIAIAQEGGFEGGNAGVTAKAITQVKDVLPASFLSDCDDVFFGGLQQHMVLSHPR